MSQSSEAKPIDVVIETPAGSRTKYAWDPDAKRFRANKVLPLGMAFPFDFGFVPETRADDVLVLADAPLAVGAIVTCRLLGVLAVEQAEAAGQPVVRNDRLIAVPTEAIRGAAWRSLDDPGEVLLSEIEDFFRTYVERAGRSFRLLGRGDAAQAARVIRQARR